MYSLHRFIDLCYIFLYKGQTNKISKYTENGKWENMNWIILEMVSNKMNILWKLGTIKAITIIAREGSVAIVRSTQSSLSAVINSPIDFFLYTYSIETAPAWFYMETVHLHWDRFAPCATEKRTTKHAVGTPRSVGALKSFVELSALTLGLLFMEKLDISSTLLHSFYSVKSPFSTIYINVTVKVEVYSPI